MTKTILTSLAACMLLLSCSSPIKISKRELNLENVHFAHKNFDIQLLENGNIQYSLYYDNDQLKEVSTFNKKGDLNGEFKKYDQIGNMISNWNFKKNKLHGKQRSWTKEGVLKYERNYHNGIEIK